LACGRVRPAFRGGRDNVGGIIGIHVDGFARELLNMPERLVILMSAGVSLRDAACPPIGASAPAIDYVGLKGLLGRKEGPVNAGGRLVTCAATSRPTTTINLMQLFQRQYGF
jgi:hypothetical protein